METRLKVKQFVQRLNISVVGFTCLDLFVITADRIYSICAAVISYFVIIVNMQAKISMKHKLRALAKEEARQAKFQCYKRKFCNQTKVFTGGL